MNTYQIDIDGCEAAIGFSFNNKELLQNAFVHRSFTNEKAGRGLKHNERLEFLGDAVLELVMTDFLFEKFPQEPEGILTAYRAAMVNTESLFITAKELGLGDFLLLSKGERMDTKKGRDHILANTYEALVGATYIDGGFDAAQNFIERTLFGRIDRVVSEKLYKDSKSFFQEKAQELEKVTPHYTLMREEGPDHDKVFVMGVFIGEDMIAEGEGASKQKAEVVAARIALEKKGWV